MDVVLALWLVSELNHEFDKPLNLAYIDIKAAFDSVDYSALWKALEANSIPLFLNKLIKDLNNGTTLSVRVGSDVSGSFRTTSRVQQGCILATTLFCCAIDWIMCRCQNGIGIDISNMLFTNLDYYDDAVLMESRDQ